MGDGVRAVLAALVAFGVIATGSPGGRAAGVQPASDPVLPAPYMHMVDPTSGWAVAKARVLRTDDGGAEWSDVTPKDVPADFVFNLARGAAGFADPFFLNATTGWVPYSTATDGTDAVGGLMVTKDAGTTWRRVPLALPARNQRVQLDFVNPDDGWMLVFLGGGCCQSSVDLYHTTDGGRRWAEVSSVSQSNRKAPGTMPWVGFKTISFVSSEVGFVVSSGFADGLGEQYLERTDDGGRTWRRVTLPKPPGYDPNHYEMQLGVPVFSGAESGTLWLAGVTTSGGAVLTVYGTTDGGLRWVPVAPLFTKSLLHPEFVSATSGFAAVRDRLYVTADAGGTWSSLPLPAKAAPTFVNAHDGFAWSSDWLWQTADGGSTWAATPLALTSGGRVMRFADVLHLEVGDRPVAVRVDAGSGASYRIFATTLPQDGVVRLADVGSALAPPEIQTRAVLGDGTSQLIVRDAVGADAALMEVFRYRRGTWERVFLATGLFRFVALPHLSAPVVLGTGCCVGHTGGGGLFAWGYRWVPFAGYVPLSPALVTLAMRRLGFADAAFSVTAAMSRPQPVLRLALAR